MNNSPPEDRAIVLFSDFGLAGPYVGQIKSVLARLAPTLPVIDMMHDAPRFDPVSSAYLLAALVAEFPSDAVFCCVVDPGVGGTRYPVAVNVGQQWFVGPDNGLFNIVAMRARGNQQVKWWRIDWQPERLSSSFHGRDLFAPVAARLAMGESVPLQAMETHHDSAQFPPDINRIIYIDHFGNAMTGLRSQAVREKQHLLVNKARVPWSGTFSQMGLGQGFWYRNCIGLVEIAVNQGRADQTFDLRVGDIFEVV